MLAFLTQAFLTMLVIVDPPGLAPINISGVTGPSKHSVMWIAER